MSEIEITVISKKVEAQLELELDECTVQEAIKRIAIAEDKMTKAGYSEITVSVFERYECAFICLEGSRKKTENEKLTSLQQKQTVGYQEYLRLKRQYGHLDMTQKHRSK